MTIAEADVRRWLAWLDELLLAAMLGYLEGQLAAEPACDEPIIVPAKEAN